MHKSGSNESGQKVRQAIRGRRPGSDDCVCRVLVVLLGAVCVLVVVEWQQQVLPTLLMMVIRTKQIIGLKLGSCFLLLPAAALLVH